MSKNKQIFLRVCRKCDAPLPYRPETLNYFNYSKLICDDCLEIIKSEN